MPEHPAACPDCGTQIAPRLVACPVCGRLVHGDRLRRLAHEAEAATQRKDLTTALTAWRDALDLLPPASRQANTIAERVQALSERVDGGEGQKKEPARPIWTQGGGVLAAAGLFLWKFKAILAFLVTKGKVLLLGLTKSSTLFSMLLAAGVYWTIWGWQFAVGLVVAIYIHEMGHVVALERFGIRATPPMFLPGLGAIVRLKQSPQNAVEDARIGLAGPIWGLGSVVAAYLLFHLTGLPIFAAISQFAAWLNLFNLLPVWQLDGSRGFRALHRTHRFWVAATFAGMWFFTEESLLVLLALTAGFRAATGPAPEISDRTTLWQFLLLVVTLAGFCTITVPGV